MSVPNVLPEAQDEIAEAIDWYEARRPGLGVEFLGAIDIAFRSIAEEPERYETLRPSKNRGLSWVVLCGRADWMPIELAASTPTRA